MRPLLFLFILLFCVTTASAQITSLPVNGTGVKTTRMSMTGAEMKKMLGEMNVAPGIYDEQGKLMDSVAAMKLVKTYEYGVGLRSTGEGKNYRRVFSKINLEARARRDAALKKEFAPRNSQLQEGMVLDIKPFGDVMPEARVKGKALVIIFWQPGCFSGSAPDGFKENNEIIGNYISKGNFEVYAITAASYDLATNALRTSPILNAHHQFNAPDLVNIYAPDTKPTYIVTDKEHRITYAIRGNVAPTPHTLNALLKAL